ncbi:PLBD1 isoform 2 [Pongo abelii]|uniref:PLBD1 isoform 2 n=1 Tax=Pongo abelii TaxID=9601 RepID=A0A2J8SQS5_PONAB|nr:PLBD1 isoform 2 [Pongo abelii]
MTRGGPGGRPGLPPPPPLLLLLLLPPLLLVAAEPANSADT